MLSCNNRISLHCTAHFSVRTNESEKKKCLNQYRTHLCTIITRERKKNTILSLTHFSLFRFC